MIKKFERKHIFITGSDAEEFLQGQLTTDVYTLPMNQWRVAAHCQPQGKVLAVGLLAKTEHGFIFILNPDIAEALAKRLTLFTLHKNVQIALMEYGLSTSGETEKTAKLENQQLILGGLTEISVAAWINAKIADIGVALQAQYLPQQLGLEDNDGLSYHKGCYIGQEAVARAHYKGAVNRHLHRLRGQGILDIGEKLSVEGQNAATVILFAESEALAVVQDRFIGAPLSNSAGVVFQVV